MLISDWDRIKLSHLHLRWWPTLLGGSSLFLSSLFLFKTILAIPGSFLLRTHPGLTLSHCREDAGVPFIQRARCSVTWTDTTKPVFASPLLHPLCFFPPLYSMLPTTACLEKSTSHPFSAFNANQNASFCRKHSAAAPDILLSGFLPFVPISGMLSMADIP